MHPVALASRELPDLLLLVRPAEVEGAHIGARAHPAGAHRDLRLALGDLFPDRVVGVQAVAGLIDIAEHHGLADAERA